MEASVGIIHGVVLGTQFLQGLQLLLFSFRKKP
jgi:hypothetical protein